MQGYKRDMDRQTDPSLREIEAALDLYDVSATRFGYAVLGDPALVAKLRKGRRLRPWTAGKIREALARLARGEKL